MSTTFHHFIIAFSILAAAQGAAAQSWKPARNVELVAASAAGGGSDNLARLIQKIVQEQSVPASPASQSIKPDSQHLTSQQNRWGCYFARLDP